jgi:hypothetical protein
LAIRLSAVLTVPPLPVAIGQRGGAARSHHFGPVSDVQAAAGFYRDKRGFTIDFLHGQPAFYASVSPDEACIHLRFVNQPMYVAVFAEGSR